MAIAVLTPVIGLLTVITAGTAHADAQTRFHRVGTMAYGPNNGQVEAGFTRTLMIDPGLHRAAMVVATAPPTVRVFDTSSLTRLADVKSPADFQALDDDAAQLPGAQIDTVNHRAMYGVTERGGQACPNAAAINTNELGFLDLRTLKWTEFHLPCLTAGDSFGLTGFTYVAGENAIYAFGNDSTVEQFETGSHNQSWYLLKVDAASGKLDWQARLASCNSDWTSTFPYSGTLVQRQSGYIYVTCETGGSATPAQTVLVKVPLDARGSSPLLDPTGTALDAITDPLVYFGFPVEPDQGSPLMVQLSYNNAYGFGAYVFDTSANLFRGFVETSNDVDKNGVFVGTPRAVGMDPSLGRLYMRTQEGMLVSDIRHRPLPVALAYPDLHETFDWDNNQGNSTHPISVDPSLHRLFIPDYALNAFLVLDDTDAPTPDNPPANPDQATIDHAEQAGVTGVAYSGSGNGYGLYILSEGGPDRGVENTVQGDCPFTNQDASPYNLLLPMLACPETKVFTPGDRVLFLGHVADNAITNVGVGTSAATVDAADAATAKDLQRAGAYGFAPPGQPTPSFDLQQTMNNSGNSLLHFPIDRPVDRPRCADFGGKPKNAGEQSAVGSTTVACDQSVPNVTATANFDGASVVGGTGLPDIGNFYSTVTTTKSAQGVVVTVTAWARHITIALPGAPAIQIAEIKTVATTAAHGRPGTAQATFTRSISGVVTPTYQCPGACDPQKVADAITAAFAQSQVDAVATVPAATREATGGGYEGVLTKNLDLQASDATVNDDASDTAAGLAITYYDDGQNGKARDVFQFAGVHAEAHYGIFLLSSGEPPADFNAPPSGPTDNGVVAPVVVPTTAPPATTQHTSHKNKPSGISGAVGAFADILHEGWRLLVSDPKRALMLAALWSLLLSPAYLALRRRALVTTLFRGTA